MLELKDDAAPTHSNTKVIARISRPLLLFLILIHKDPPPWIPAITQHTTAGMTDTAELHMVRAVNTGIINVKHSPFLSLFFAHSYWKLSLAIQESDEKIRRERQKNPPKKKRTIDDKDKEPKLQGQVKGVNSN